MRISVVSSYIVQSIGMTLPLFISFSRSELDWLDHRGACIRFTTYKALIPDFKMQSVLLKVAVKYVN